MKYQREKVEYETIWNGDKTQPHGGMLNACPEDHQIPPSLTSGVRHDGERRGRPIGRLYVAPDNALASGHFAEDES